LSGGPFVCGNVGADLGLVAARVDSASETALFFLPRSSEYGLNYSAKWQGETHVRADITLRGGEAFLLGETTQGADLRGEVLAQAQAAGSMASVARAQCALADVFAFASGSGTRAIEPDVRRALEEQIAALELAFALAWEAVLLVNWTCREVPGLYSDTFQLARLVARLAQPYNSGVAADVTRWAADAYPERSAEPPGASGFDAWEDAAPRTNRLDSREQRLLLVHLALDADGTLLRQIETRLDGDVDKFAPWVARAVRERLREGVRVSGIS
jgi:hypothetical protein